MDTETYRWKPSVWLIAAYALGGTAFLGLLFYPVSRIGPVAALLSESVMILLGGVIGAVFWQIASYRLELGPDALALFTGPRERWRIPWPDLLEAHHERGTHTRWDRLILRTKDGERTMKLDDGLAGRWDDPAALIAALGGRGYAVR